MNNLDIEELLAYGDLSTRQETANRLRAEEQAKLAPTQSSTDSPFNEKATMLSAAKAQKVALLGAKKDTLLGMSDADTYSLKDAGKVRGSTISNGGFYDAVELNHGNAPYDMYGTNNKTAGKFEKSAASMAAQRKQVANLLGKDINAVTQQDMIDVGNMQQIQMLADLSRAPGEKRWEAPLIRNAVQADISGTQKDQYGKAIPLNIPIMHKDLGTLNDSQKRGLGLVGNMAGEDSTTMASKDNRLNSSLFYGKNNGLVTSTKTIPVTNQISGYNVSGGKQGDYATSPEFAKIMTSRVYSLGGEGALNSPKKIQAAILSNNKGNMTAKEVADLANIVYYETSKTGMDPTLLVASMLVETGNFSSNVFKNNKNLGGVTWNDSMKNIPGMSKGTARPASEGGYYVKFDSPAEGVKRQVQAWNKQRVTSSKELPILSPVDRAANTLKAFGYMATDQLANLADLPVEVVEKIATGKKWKDTKGLYTEENKKQLIDFLGYDQSFAQAAGDQAVSAVKSAVDKGDYSKIFGAIGNALMTPELAGEVGGYMASLILPGKIMTAVLRGASGVNTAAKAILASKKASTMAEAISMAEKVKGPAYKLANILSGNSLAGTLSFSNVSGAEQFARQAEDTYKELYNTDMPDEQRAAARLLGLVYVNVDLAMGKMIIKGTDPISKVIPGLLKQMPESVSKSFMGKIAKTAVKVPVRLTGTALEEGSTEMLQSAMEESMASYNPNVEDYGLNRRESLYNIGASGILGAAGGIQMAGPSTALSLVPGRDKIDSKSVVSPSTKVDDSFKEFAKEKGLDKLDSEGTAFISKLYASAKENNDFSEIDNVIEQFKAADPANPLITVFGDMKDHILGGKQKEAKKVATDENIGTKESLYQLHRDAMQSDEGTLDDAYEVYSNGKSVYDYYNNTERKSNSKDTLAEIESSRSNAETMIVKDLTARIGQLTEGMPEGTEIDPVAAHALISEVSAKSGISAEELVGMFLVDRELGNAPTLNPIIVVDSSLNNPINSDGTEGMAFKISMPDMQAIESLEQEIQAKDAEYVTATPERQAEIINEAEAIGNKIDEINSRYTKDEVSARTSTSTAENTEGISGRTIDKYAKMFNVDSSKLAAALDVSFAKFKIMNMKGVSKGANDVQYSTYFDSKDGILTLFVKYKTALAEGNAEEAIKILRQLRKIAKNKLVAYKNFERIYEDYKRYISNARTLDDKIAIIGVLRKKYKESQFKDTPNYSSHRLDAFDVAMDMYKDDPITKQAIIDAFGVTEIKGKSDTLAIMESMLEAADHVNNILIKEGQQPVTISGTVVEYNDDRKRYTAELSKLENDLIDAVKTLEDVLANEDSNDTDIKLAEDKVLSIKASIGDQTEGIERTRQNRGRSRFIVDEDITDINEKIVKAKNGLDVGTITKKEAKELKEAGIDITDMTIVSKVPKVVSKEDTVNEIAKLKQAKLEKEQLKSVIGKTGDKLEKEITDKYTDISTEVYAKLSKIDAKLGADVKQNTVNFQNSSERLATYIKHLDKLVEDRKGVAKELNKIKVINKAKDKAEVAKGIADKAHEALVTEVNADSSKGSYVSRVKARLNNMIAAIKTALGEAIVGGKVILKYAVAMHEEAGLQEQLTLLDKEIAMYQALKAEEISKQVSTGLSKTMVNKHTKALEKLINVKRLKDKVNKTDIKKLDQLTTLIDRIIESFNSGRVLNKELKTSMASKVEEYIQPKIGDALEGQPLNIHTLIKINPNIINSLELSELVSLIDDKKVSNDLLNKVKATNQALATILDTTTSRYTSLDSPFASLLVKNDGSMNEAIVTAMTLSLNEFIGANGSALVMNSNETIAKMRGLISESQLNYMERTLLRRGKFLKIVSNQLGKAILNTAGINAGELSEAHYNKLISDAGQIGVLVMEQMGLIEEVHNEKNGISISDYKAMIALSKATSSSEDIEVDSTIETGTAYVPMVKGIKSKIEQYTKLSEEIRDITDALTVDSSNKNYRTNSYSKKTQDNKKYGVHGSIFDAPKTAQETIKVLENDPYMLIIDAVKGLLDMIKNPESLVAIKDNMGYKDIESMKGKYVLDDIEAQEAKNLEIDRSLSELELMYARVNPETGTVGNEVFFDWFFAKNGRYMLDSVGINPQTDKKMHRFLVSSKNNLREWDKSNAEDMEYFYQAIAQAFGFGIDKQATKTTTTLGKALVKVSPEDLKQAIIDGKLELNGKELDIEHPGHALQALEAIKAYNSGDKFTAIATAEYDQLTSGFMFKLMQLPVLDRQNLIKWLAKTGVFVEDGGDNGLTIRDADGNLLGMNDIIASEGFLDSYRTLTSDVNKSITDKLAVEPPKKMTKTIDTATKLWKVSKALKLTEDLVVNEAVTSFGRNLFKYPFMIFNYAGSLKAIRSTLGYNLAKGVIDKIIDGSLDGEEYKEFRKVLVADDKQWAALKAKLVDGVTYLDDVKLPNGTKLNEVLSEMYNRTYGMVFEDVMTKEFGPMIEVNKAMTDASKLMFRAFKIKYEQAYVGAINVKNNTKFKDANEYRAYISNNKGVIKGLTEAESDELTRSLIDTFPAIKSAYSKSRLDGIAIIDEKTIDNKYNELDKVRTHVKNKTDKKTVTVQAMIKEYSEAMSSGAVLPIHWEDGAVMAELLAQGGILGVHDAIIIGKDFKNHILNMNKAIHDIAGNYNLLDSFVQALSTTLKQLSKEEIDQIAEFGYGDETYGVNEVVTSLLDQQAKVEEGREFLRSHNVVVGNVAAPAGTMYSGMIKTPTKGKLQDYLGKINNIDKIEAALNAAIEECK